MSNVIEFKSKQQLQEDKEMQELWDLMAPILHEHNERYLRELSKPELTCV